MKNDLKLKLDHSRAAYRFAVSQLPPPPGGPWPMTIGDFKFEKGSQVHSMQQEFGWAFFCRYEGCVEAFLKSANVRLSRKLSLSGWLMEKRIPVPEKFSDNLEKYRSIRNSLHHDDGAALPGQESPEIDLPPPLMEDFYQLFVWIGEVVAENTKGDRPHANGSD